MASIRRTLSPVPRQGTALNGEVCSVGSPLSKSSSCSPHYPSTTGGVFSSLLGLSDSQALVLGVYSPRTSRPLDRSKPRGQSWRKALMHFFICFSIGIFIGLISFASMEFSLNSISKHQAFSFDMVRNSQVHDSETSDEIPFSDNEGVRTNTTVEPRTKEKEPGDRIVGGNGNHQTLLQEESTLVSRKLLIVVTPTYARPFQAYYLNRLAHTLKLVQPPLLWIVVEMTAQSEETANSLRRTGVMYRHLVCEKNLTNIVDRNVHQRNVALAHIETHHLDGIVYFADDSNVYSVDLFEQMRQIRRFGTWKVAKINGDGNKAIVEGPICNGTQVIGWHTNEPSRRFRRFHAEMSGFAFNSTILWDPKRWHRATVETIRQLDTVEDDFKASSFIEQVLEDESQMEGLPEDCSKIMAWQLHLEAATSSYPVKWFLKDSGDFISPLA